LALKLFKHENGVGQKYLLDLLHSIWSDHLVKEWRALFKSHGCGALEVLHNNNADHLCGRDPGTNVAIQSLNTMATLRWLCPVTCGCTVDPRGCPFSCQDGVETVAMDPCLADFCLPGSRVNISRSVSMRSCGDIIARINRSIASTSSIGSDNRDARFQECEQLRITYAPLCCDIVA